MYHHQKILLCGVDVVAYVNVYVTYLMNSSWHEKAYGNQLTFKNNVSSFNGKLNK